MEVLYLKSQGLSHQDILRLSGITSRTTLAKYFRQYQAEGIDGLKRLDYKGQPSALNPHIPSLKPTSKRIPRGRAPKLRPSSSG